ncbi:unnamed protein product [Spirodela intermedia]|uniref:Uncharacterized protein n=1 Tax=Spirodela intermedia TaxID=51605 RepID=A0ABN7EAT3_SPIIN|nr:unnamed protein product [Spirodela intermedia]
MLVLPPISAFYHAPPPPLYGLFLILGILRVRKRTLTEEHARDSFENLLFSVCRFRELTGDYPRNITVRPTPPGAIGFPRQRFSFVGTPAAPAAREAATKGEAAVRAQFQEDPFGCSGALRRKRLRRDPFHRSVPYPAGCPELRGLFDYCGPAPYPGPLPWGPDRLLGGSSEGEVY